MKNRETQLSQREIATRLTEALLAKLGVQSLDNPEDINKIAIRAVEMTRTIAESFPKG